jgi:hypothetical protein
MLSSFEFIDSNSILLAGKKYRLTFGSILISLHEKRIYLLLWP